MKNLLLVVTVLASGTVLAQTAPVPCAQDPLFSQQDFTLGQWEVFANGRKTADVLLEKTLQGCAILETWSTLDGRPGNGHGVFTYSRLHKGWTYFWVADNAQTTSFTGGLIEAGNMRYVTEAPLPDGGKRLRHWSLIRQADGTVRELAVGTVDGKTWTTDYDLLWRKKP